MAAYGINISYHDVEQNILEQNDLNKVHFTSGEHLGNFPDKILMFAYYFLICLFISMVQVFFILSIIPRYLHWSTFGMSNLFK